MCGFHLNDRMSTTLIFRTAFPDSKNRAALYMIIKSNPKTPNPETGIESDDRGVHFGNV